MKAACDRLLDQDRARNWWRLGWLYHQNVAAFNHY